MQLYSQYMYMCVCVYIYIYIYIYTVYIIALYSKYIISKTLISQVKKSSCLNLGDKYSHIKHHLQVKAVQNMDFDVREQRGINFFAYYPMDYGRKQQS